MTAQELIAHAEYKLFSRVTNPHGGDPRELDWRRKSAWEYDTRFHCYQVYVEMGRSVPALYHGQRPGEMVHEFLMAPIFEALLGCLERVK